MTATPASTGPDRRGHGRRPAPVSTYTSTTAPESTRRGHLGRRRWGPRGRLGRGSDGRPRGNSSPAPTPRIAGVGRKLVVGTEVALQLGVSANRTRRTTRSASVTGRRRPCPRRRPHRHGVVGGAEQPRPATTEAATIAIPIHRRGSRHPGVVRAPPAVRPSPEIPGHGDIMPPRFRHDLFPQARRPAADGPPGMATCAHGRPPLPHPRRRGGGPDTSVAQVYALVRRGELPAIQDRRPRPVASGDHSSRSSSTRPTPMPPSTSRSTPSRSPTPRSPPTDPPRRGVDSCPPKCVFLRAEAAILARRSSIRRVFARRSACSCAPKLSILAESRRPGVPQDAERRLKHPQIPHTRHAIPHTSARDSSRLGAHLTPRA